MRSRRESSSRAGEQDLYNDVVSGGKAGSQKFVAPDSWSIAMMSSSAVLSPSPPSPSAAPADAMAIYRGGLRPAHANAHSEAERCCS